MLVPLVIHNTIDHFAYIKSYVCVWVYVCVYVYVCVCVHVSMCGKNG